mmetsp:Transcript_32978/g.129412  ORF Transcript_32978/g.129412 Transcript_32978/m.129412 type:complete len:406 (-) Transcript_32978:446-1663(-)
MMALRGNHEGTGDHDGKDEGSTFLNEDFELGVIENAYRSGTMPRLTGVSSGAPLPGINFTNEMEGRQNSHAMSAGGLFADELDDFDPMHDTTSRLPIDGTEPRQNGLISDETGGKVPNTNGTTKSLAGSKRSHDSLDNDNDDDDSHSFSKQTKTGKDSNKSHTRKCREKVNDKFKQLLEELPMPPAGIELQHKAQILDYTIKTLKELSNRKTSLETELAFSSKKNLLRWVDNVISNAKNFPDAVKPFLDMFCTKKGWKYAELWLPAKNVGETTHGNQREMLLRLRRWVLNRSLGSEERENLLKFAAKSEHFTFNPRVGVPGRVFSTLRPEWLPQLDNDETFVRASEASEFGLNVCLAVPVVVRGQVAAVTVFFDTEVRDYDADCLDLAIDIASLTGNAYGAKTGF